MAILSAHIESGQLLFEFAAEAGEGMPHHYQEMGAEGPYGNCRARYIDGGSGEVWIIHYHTRSAVYLQISGDSSGLYTCLSCEGPGGEGPVLAQSFYNTVFRSRALRGEGCCVVVMTPEESPLLQERFLLYVLDERPRAYGEASTLFYAIRDCPPDHPLLQSFMALKCDELCLLLLHKAAVANRVRMPGGVAEKLRDVAELIRAQPEKNFSIRELARAGQINETDLKRYFKQRYGMTVHAFILSVKMQEALHLLLHSRDKVKDIAAALGFGSESGFTNQFKRLYGVTPGKVRR